ncbi:MAG: K(+)-transporting ATPase subunit F [Microcoleaceae cyanobacterium]
MKLTTITSSLSLTWNQLIQPLQQQKRFNPMAFALFFSLCFNLVIAPVIYAATGEDLTRKAAYALGILLLVVVALSVYLFVVIFQPERF